MNERPVSVQGTQLLASDSREVRRQKLARITLDSLVQLVAVLDARGSVLEINQVALDAVGMTLRDVEHQPFWATPWWQVSPEINARLRECLRRAAGGELVRWDTPIHGQAGGKQTIIIDASLTPVKDDDGKVVFIIAEGRDITAALRSSEDRYRALITASSDAVYRMNPDWSEMQYLAGRQFIADTHLPTREWLEKYVHEDDRPRVLEAIRIAVERKSVFELEHRVRRADGSPGWTFSRALPLMSESGEILEWIGMASDITERKELEASLRIADRRKDEFLATLAHELRNPLAPIRNAVHLLKSTEPTDPTIRSARDIVDRQVRHMVRLVDDLMDVSRITLGQINLRADRINLRSVLTDAVEAAAPFVESRRHALTVQLPAEPLTIEGDATRLSQVFQNLLNNAAKYTPEGGQIALQATRQGPHIVVSVRDNGVGIPPDQQVRVFELFTRVDPGDRIKTAGLGIGLALARQLIELHGGRIELRSEGTGRGSEFIVHLPARDKPATEALDATERLAEETRGDRRRVLIADDNQDASESLAILLQMDGYIVKTAADGYEALRVIDGFVPDIVLLDIGMPGLNGYEVAERIRKLPTCQHAAIVALTGWGQPEDKLQARKAGFDEHLTKPVDPDVLATILEAIRR